MKRRTVWIAAFALVGVTALPAHASDHGPWGTPEEAKPCEALDSQACKAEISRRAKLCTHDTEETPSFILARKGKSKADGDAACLAFCTDAATAAVEDQLAELVQNDAEKKKDEEAHRGKMESVELPEAKQHNAKLEQAVIAAYIKGGYKENKVLKVILGDWSSDYEKDAFGRVTGRDLWATVVNKHPDGKCELFSELWLQYGNGRSFSGPLSERGAGSLETAEILCSKAEKADKPKKK